MEHIFYATNIFAIREVAEASGRSNDVADRREMQNVVAPRALQRSSLMVSSLSVWLLDAGPLCPYSPRTWADAGGAFDRVLLRECSVSPRIVSR